MKRLLGGVAVSALLAAPALAADLRMPVKAAPAPIVAAYSWTGCYIGAQVGAIAERARYDDIGAGTGISYNETGIIGGGHIGCNWQTGQWVFGIEGDGNGTSAKADDAGFGGVTDTTHLNWTASIRGRVGIAVSATLFYATGGVAFAGIEQERSIAGLSESPRKTFTGWTVGGGIEHGFTPNWSFRAEYRYSDYGTERFTYTAFTSPVDVKVKTHQGIFGVTYRFGASPVVARY